MIKKYYVSDLIILLSVQILLYFKYLLDYDLKLITLAKIEVILIKELDKNFGYENENVDTWF